MFITLVAAAVALLVAGGLSFGRFARSDTWAATVTPLASIIGSGFLISGPLLAREFGGAAFWAMAALLLLAYAVGGVIRWNIVHVENYLAGSRFNDPVVWAARVTQVVLAGAYAVSVAYYLKLLAEFAMKPLAVPDAWHGLVSNIGVTAIIAVLMLLAFGGGLRRVEHVAHGTVSIKIGHHRRPARRAGMLVGDASRIPRHDPGGHSFMGKRADAARPADHRAGVRDVALSRPCL